MLKTYAFIDLETTSLAFAKITEIAVVACERDHCYNSNELPRVLHKFSVCVRPPEKVHPMSAIITGLDNDNLMNVGTFNEDVAKSLNLFFKRLPQPVCLVAHNGLKFDFPILKRAFEACGTALLDGVYCLDSLTAFRKLLSAKTNQNHIHPAFNNPEEDLICLQAIEEYEESIKNISQMELNETTPKKDYISLNLAPKKKPLTRSQASNHNSSARKRLDFDSLENSGSSLILSQFLTDYERGNSPPSYKLVDLYEYFHGVNPIESHRAENDAITLLECVLKLKDLFFDYADDNAVLFKTLK